MTVKKQPKFGPNGPNVNKHTNFRPNIVVAYLADVLESLP